MISCKKERMAFVPTVPSFSTVLPTSGEQNTWNWARNTFEGGKGFLLRRRVIHEKKEAEKKLSTSTLVLTRFGSPARQSTYIVIEKKRWSRWKHITPRICVTG